MNTLNQHVLVLVTATIVAGCAGRDFKRPDPQSLVVGESTTADVIGVMGKSLSVSEAVMNGQNIKTMSYMYAGGFGSTYPDVTPVRLMAFLTFNDLLVSQEFISSFKEDATDFDESKLNEIVKGKTTRAEVQATMGEPSGEAIYPVIKKSGETAFLYTYREAKGGAYIKLTIYQKKLVVWFDPTGVVTEIEFSSGWIK